MSRFLESYNKDKIGLLGKKYKHLAGQHDQAKHGAWAGNKSSETSLVKLSGSVRVPTVEEVSKNLSKRMGVAPETVEKMILAGAFLPSELDKEKILKSVLEKRLSGAQQKVPSIDDKDLITIAEVVQNLPPIVRSDIQLRLNDKDLTTGASPFGTSGVWEPAKTEKNFGLSSRHVGFIELFVQSDNSAAHKAWVTAHEFGHTVSMPENGEKSFVLEHDDLLTLLGFGNKKTFPEGFVSTNGSVTDIPRDSEYRSLRNSLNHYMKNQGPPYYVIRKDQSPWTGYGHSHPEEAFAEAFAGYMVSPKALKRDRPMLYNYMKENVFGGLEYDGYSDEPPKLNF